jgi:hypothetical protein
VHESAFVRALRGRVLFDSHDETVEALLRALAPAGHDAIDDATRAAYCDPFRDGHALERLADLCLNLRKAA